MKHVLHCLEFCDTLIQIWLWFCSSNRILNSRPQTQVTQTFDGSIQVIATFFKGSYKKLEGKIKARSRKPWGIVLIITYMQQL